MKYLLVKHTRKFPLQNETIRKMYTGKMEVMNMFVKILKMFVKIQSAGDEHGSSVKTYLVSSSFAKKWTELFIQPANSLKDYL